MPPPTRAKSRRILWLVVFAVLAAIVAPDDAGAESPTLDLQPLSGPPTTSVRLTATGFAPDGVVDISFDSQILSQVAPDESGGFTKTIRVPRSAVAGDHQVTAGGERSSASATATFTVVLPAITLNESVGPPLAHLIVTGVSFRALEPVQLAFDSKVLGSPIADPSGGFSERIRVPMSVEPGRHRVTATGETSTLVAKAAFRIRIDDWPQYGFGPAHEGHNPRESILDTSTVGGLVSSWTTRIGHEGALAVGFSSPAIVKGVAYIGSEVGKVYAVNAWTGKIKWVQTAFKNWHTWSSPAVVKGVVYIGSDGLYALRASTGARLWKVKVGDDTWSPTVGNGAVYVISKPGKLYAVDASDGSILWTKQIGYAGATVAGAAPTVADGTVYVGSVSHDLYALDATTGEVRWKVPMGAEAGTSPTVFDGVVYAPSTEGLRALRASTGELLWTAAILGGGSSPAIADDVVYIGGVQGVYAFDAASGALLWEAPIGYHAGSSPAVANGVVYVAAPSEQTDDNLRALDAQSGEVLWAGSIGGEGRCNPRVVNGMLYASSEGGNLHAFFLP